MGLLTSETFATIEASATTAATEVKICCTSCGGAACGVVEFASSPSDHARHATQLKARWLNTAAGTHRNKQVLQGGSRQPPALVQLQHSAQRFGEERAPAHGSRASMSAGRRRSVEPTPRCEASFNNIEKADCGEISL